MHSQLAAAKLAQSQQAELANVPHELTAMDFLSGTNDVQRLVGLQRIWLRLLSIQASRRDETRAAEVREVISELQRKDRQAKHVLSQLRDGEVAALKMWLLIAKRG
jgi:hypothetical protein